MSVFPFTAIVGQEQMKLALVLNVINPTIGGVLIMGEKGTAKSTAVRSLAELLPEMDVSQGCSFNCDPHGFLCNSCRDAVSEEGSLPGRETKDASGGASPRRYRRPARGDLGH